MEKNTEATTLRLEGALAGEWIDEMLSCWQQLVASCDQLPVEIDLSGVTWASNEGRELLALMYRNGARLVASGVLMNSVVEEITTANQPVDICLTERREL